MRMIALLLLIGLLATGCATWRQKNNDGTYTCYSVGQFALALAGQILCAEYTKHVSPPGRPRE